MLFSAIVFIPSEKCSLNNNPTYYTTIPVGKQEIFYEFQFFAAGISGRLPETHIINMKIWCKP